MKHLLLILLLPALLMGADTSETGTLIVTYQTDNKSERLDRVRFRLNKRTLYPQGTAYVDDAEKRTRMVVIENLPPGDYLIDFIIPNLDGYFSPVPQREVTITGGEAVKINQEIKPNQEHSLETAQNLPDETEQEETPEEQEEVDISYGKLIVSFDLPDAPARTDDIYFRIASLSGEATTHPMPGKDTVIALETGKMVMVPKLPAGNYTLEFFIEGSQEPLAKKSFEVQADRTKSVHQPLTITAREQTSPSLTLLANTPSAEFELRNLESGKFYQGKGKEVSFNQVPTGMYELRFNSSDPFFTPPPAEKIEVRKEGFLIKEAAYTPLGKINISTNIDEAKAQITPMDKGLHPYKKEIRERKASLYLPEGKYRITFHPVKGHESPEPVDIDVQPLQTEHINIHF